MVEAWEQGKRGTGETENRRIGADSISQELNNSKNQQLMRIHGPVIGDVIFALDLRNSELTTSL
jgi:hypothetical protein